MPKLATRITDIKIRNLKPKEKPYKHAAGRGLHLLVKPDGSKHWLFRFRFEGKENSISMGRYPEVTLSSAEDKVTEAHRLIDSGTSPSENRKSIKQTRQGELANTFEAVARDWWQSHMKDKADSHKNKVIRRFELYLFPVIGKLPISDITAPELLKAIKAIEAMNILETAHRTLQTAGQVFRYAVQNGKARHDITSDLRGALPATQVTHMAAFTEPKDVAELLRAIEGFKGTFVVKSALLLSPHIFVRPGELRRMKWDDINFEEAVWKRFVTKTKLDHIVPLSKQVIELLKKLHQHSGHGEYVFPGGHSPLKPMSESAVNAALKRMGYDTQKDITGHGFRAMARTIIHERLNFPPDIIEHQLAHKVPDALGKAYNRTKFIQQRIEMMQVWSDYLDEIKAGATINPLMISV